MSDQTISKQKGQVTIKGPDGDYTLRLTLGAIAQIEEGLNIEALSSIDSALGSGSIRPLSIVLLALLAGGGNPLSKEDLMGWELNMGDLMQGIREAFKAAGFSDPDAAPDDLDEATEEYVPPKK